jgi:hypothetical protein
MSYNLSWTPPKSKGIMVPSLQVLVWYKLLNIPVLSWYIVSFENLHSKKKFSLICTCRKECNKYDLTAAQYFWLVDHNDWSMWFVAISSPSPPTYFACPSFSFFIGGVEPEYITILGLWKIFSQSSHILSSAGDALRSLSVWELVWEPAWTYLKSLGSF